MNLQIRTATVEDAEGILGVFNPIIKTGKYSVFTEPFTLDAERAFIAGLHKRAIFHLAVRESSGEIVGFQSLEPFATYTPAFAHVGVMGTFVSLNHHRQGIAARLFAATFAVARQKGYEKIHTFVRADNLAGLQAYLGQGFHIVGAAHRQAKINGIYIDEVIIERFL